VHQQKGTLCRDRRVRSVYEGQFVVIARGDGKGLPVDFSAVAHLFREVETHYLAVLIIKSAGNTSIGGEIAQVVAGSL